MFTDEGKYDFLQLRETCNALEIELQECAVLNPSFHVHGTNTHVFSRIFCVIDAKAPYSTLELTDYRKELEMKPGFSYFISAGDRLRFDLHDCYFISFHFTTSLFHSNELFHQQGLLLALPTLPDWQERLLSIMKQSNKIISAIQLKSLLLEKISEIPLDIGNERLRLFQRDSVIFKYLHHEATAKTTCSDISDLMNMSQDTLSRRFKIDYGIPLKRVLSNAIISRAEIMLRNPDAKVREVARKLDFASEYYFSNFFKKNTGVSPVEYRRTYGISKETLFI